MQDDHPLIREATALDAEAIGRVHVASWRATYRGIIDDDYLDGLRVEAARDRFLAGFDPRPGATFTRVSADGRGTIHGFAIAGAARRNLSPGPGEPPGAGELNVLYLLPEVQRRGIGTRLVRSMARGLERRGMEAMLVRVLDLNSACRFYERLGARRVGEREIGVGRRRLVEACYRWDDLDALLGAVAGEPSSDAGRRLPGGTE